MTVTFTGEKSGLTATNTKGVRTYTVTYKLHADGGETASVVGNDSNLPSVGSIHAEDGLAYCESLSVKQVKGKYAWEATANYTTANSIDGETGLNEDPEQDRPKITWNGSIQNVSIYKDRDDKGIQNSAGDPMLDTMDKNLYGASVSTNVTSLPSWILAYKDSINNAAFTIGGLPVAIGGARLVFPGGFISPAQQRGDYVYYTFTYDLIFDAIELHAGQLLDQGLNERFTDENTTNGLKPILLDDQQLPDAMAQLDGSGVRLANPTPATSSYITVNKYFLKDFSVLPGLS